VSLEPGTYTLWGSAHSLYTGKLRSYLIKKNLSFRELYPTHPRFGAEIQPAVGMLVVPLLETADGRVLQDTDDIIDELEATHPERPLRPDTPVQQVVSRLLCAYASEGLLSTAMHYRWSYRAEQETFLRAEFGRVAHHGFDRAARLASGQQLMNYFSGLLPALGVTPATISTLEGTYLELLDALDAHFQCHPYFLGGRPCDADFGFMAPLYAHLGRDPVPAALMKRVAPNVYRWTERMNSACTSDGEFWDQPDAHLTDDDMPATLEPVLRILFDTWWPELQANAARYESWLHTNPSMPAGHLVSHGTERKVHPTLGPIEYSVRGVDFQRASSPNSLRLFEASASLARQLQGGAAARFSALMERTGGAAAMNLRLARPLRRANYVLVLG